MNAWNPSELEEKIKSGSPLFLKLWKKGCGACKLSEPALERLEASNEFAVEFGQICSDDYPEILEIAETEVLPVFFVFKDKEMKGKFEGFKGLERLKAFLIEHLK